VLQPHINDSAAKDITLVADAECLLLNKNIPGLILLTLDQNSKK
jgi:hypothetical protein